jgi:hypothetical protein
MKKITRHNGKQPEELTVIDETVSTTGKWAIAFGKHFRPMVCFDVVAMNRMTGEVKRVHHSDNEAGARIIWDEFKKSMTAKRKESEEDEPKGFKIFGPN